MKSAPKFTPRRTWPVAMYALDQLPRAEDDDSYFFNNRELILYLLAAFEKQAEEIESSNR